MHEAASGTRVHIGDRTLISFGGCDTLGLARDPRLVEAAQEAFGGSDGPSKVMAARAESYAENPPPDDWSGTYVATEK